MCDDGTISCEDTDGDGLKCGVDMCDSDGEGGCNNKCAVTDIYGTCICAHADENGNCLTCPNGDCSGCTKRAGTQYCEDQCISKDGNGKCIKNRDDVDFPLWCNNDHDGDNRCDDWEHPDTDDCVALSSTAASVCVCTH